MQKTVGRVNNTVSPATIELLIRERSRGKTLRQLGQMFGRSHEKIRQLLAKHDRSPVTLLSEPSVAAKLGYPVHWLIKLRKDGITSPIRPGRSWLYSEEQVRQIPSLIAELRKCQQCGKPRPLGSHRFCRECRQYRDKEMLLAWKKANPERWKEIQSRSHRKQRKEEAMTQSKGPMIRSRGQELAPTRKLAEGQKVEFEVTHPPKGLRAATVRLTGETR